MINNFNSNLFTYNGVPLNTSQTISAMNSDLNSAVKINIYDFINSIKKPENTDIYCCGASKNNLQ